MPITNEIQQDCQEDGFGPSPESIEYFILSSYSCLLTVVKRLEEIRLVNGRAVLFCFTAPIYEFLSPLGLEQWVEVIRVDISSIAVPRVRSPLSVLQARRDAHRLYHQYFERIGTGRVVHFYNRHFAGLAGYIIWRLKDRCDIHYAECDPVGLLKPAWSLRAILKWYAISTAYPVPMRMVGDRRPFPELSESYLDKAVSVTYRYITDASEVAHSPVFQRLAITRSAKVLWVMSNYLGCDREIVHTEDYMALLRKCAKIVSGRYGAREQAVKFHPFARQREDIWSEGVEYLPDYVPAQFVVLPELELVITMSASALVSESAKHHVRIVSLSEMLPFVEVTTRQRFKEQLDDNMASEYSTPRSLDEFHAIVSQG